MGPVGGPAHDHLVAFGTHILKDKVQIRHRSAPSWDIAFDALGAATHPPSPIVENVVGGEHFIYAGKVARVPEIPVTLSDGFVVFCGYGISPSSPSDETLQVEGFCLRSF